MTQFGPHPYKPQPGGICATCGQPAMTPEHAGLTSSPAPTPAVAPDPTPSAAQPVNTPVPPQPTSAAATTEPAPGEPSTLNGAGSQSAESQVVWVPPNEQTPEEQAEVARMATTVELAFPAVGFIDPTAELEKMLRIVEKMPPEQKAFYPEKVRAAILLHEAGKGPEVTDEELALAIFIKRTTDTPLTQEELEAKATGKKKRDPSAPKGKKNLTKSEKSLEQLKALGF